MIEVRNLTKYYGPNIALDDLSFDVQKGEILGFLGPNGAGKSTTMKIITGFLSSTEGKVTVNGLDVFDDSLEVRKLIGYLPEHPPLYLDMTVKDYLYFAARIKGVPRNRIKKAVETNVEKCGIQNYYNSYCKSLSKGYRQRVGIAQAIVHDPSILILDEPTIGLDPIQIVEIRNLIKSFGGEHTVILSTHILPEVEVTCERVVIISDGKVVAQDLTNNLKSDTDKNRVVRLEYVGKSQNIFTTVEKIKNVEKVKKETTDSGTTILDITTKAGCDMRSEIAKAIVAENLDLLEVKYITRTLEQIFVDITMK